MNQEFAAIIQARRGSSRFRDKVLAKIFNKPLLTHIIRRVQSCPRISKIILATTIEKEDKALEKICDYTGINIFFGHSTDVLDRFYQASQVHDLSNVIRITADCPVIDPFVIERTIDKYSTSNYDYVSNSISKTFPEGLSVEIFNFKALEYAWQNATWYSEREHVTPFLYKNPSIFRIGEITNPLGNYSHLRLTVDYKLDLLLIRKIYTHLYPSYPFFGFLDIVKLLQEKPYLASINSHISKYEGYNKSLRNDSLVDKGN
jgi:spore coat polysaccharide biosynthesis protein SpsF